MGFEMKLSDEQAQQLIDSGYAYNADTNTLIKNIGGKLHIINLESETSHFYDDKPMLDRIFEALAPTAPMLLVMLLITVGIVIGISIAS